MGSGWFDCPLSTYLEEKQGVQGAFALVRCSSRRFKKMWFKKVRGGSMRLNYTELVQKHLAHLASPLNM